MNEIVDVVTRIRQVAETGKKSERRLATRILDDLRAASQASITELAASAAVSEPTVTRFCRSIGCDGVREFKFHLAQALAVGGLYLFPSVAQPAADETRTATAICDGAIAAIERARRSTDMALVTKVAKGINAASSVLVFGSGGSSSLAAVEMQNRLFRFGIPIAAHTDGQMQRMSAAVAGKGQMVIVFSLSGRTQAAVDAATLATQYGATTVAVTAPGSPLAKAVSILLPFVPAEDSNIYKPTSARYGLMVAIDMIAMVTAELRGPGIVEGMRRIKMSLKSTDAQLPIGD